MGNTCFGSREPVNVRAPPSHIPSTEKQHFIPAEDTTAMATTASMPYVAPTKVTSTRMSAMTSSVLGRPTESLRDLYQLGKELGRGQFGITYLCTEKATGQVYACKSIAKRKLVTRDDVDDVRREVQIMHHLSGHPNIVKIKGAYEDLQNVHLVMEVCAGGELFDRIISKGHYSERAAANLTGVIVGVVQHCHQLGVMHRDLKPENFLLADKTETAPLKTTDFGLSIFFKPGQIFMDVVGSPYYVAPEVLRRCYGPESDVWSAGVILYILLCGVPPFWAETEQGIFEAVLKGHIDFASEPWPQISKSAKELITHMLDQSPKRRYTAHQVLTHPWIAQVGVASDRPLDSAVLQRLKQFTAANKLKRVALKVIAESMSPEEIQGLKEMFKAMDADGNGTITFEELRDGLRKQGSKLAEEEVRAIMDAADVDNNGTIDYDEFIAATMHLNKLEKEEHIFKAFQYFDKDNSGFITMEELKVALYENGVVAPGDNSLEEILKEVDTDQNGSIDYQEFQAMMRKGLGGGRSRVAMRRAPSLVPDGAPK